MTPQLRVLHSMLISFLLHYPTQYLPSTPTSPPIHTLFMLSTSFPIPAEPDKCPADPDKYPAESVPPQTKTASTHDQDSLDSLFASLAQSTRDLASHHQSSASEFERIQDSVAKLPKITSSLEDDLHREAAKPVADVVRINDPIVRRGPRPKEATDSGDRWFNMRQPEMTDAVKRDLLIIKHRSALDPKRHYKKDKWQTPKFFQMGTLVEGNSEFYSLRINRRDRGRSLVDEVLKDENTEKYFKRKFNEIQAAKHSGKKAYYKGVQQKRRKF